MVAVVAVVEGVNYGEAAKGQGGHVLSVSSSSQLHPVVPWERGEQCIYAASERGLRSEASRCMRMCVVLVTESHWRWQGG